MKEYGKQKSDYFWFLSYRDDLVKTHFAKRVLISNKEILGFYETYLEAYLSAMEKGLKNGEYIIQICVPDGDEREWDSEPVYANCSFEDLRKMFREKRAADSYSCKSKSSIR